MVDLQQDRALVERAERVLPGGIYGHMNMKKLPEGYPQFMASGEGAHLFDVDGNRYIDYMCGWGPIVLGRQHPAVDAAAREALSRGDVYNGPGAEMVELAELFRETVPHADWTMFGKNGTDATTACVTIARAATGRSTILIAEHGYHGAIPWCTPGTAGVTAEDRANQVKFVYNDVDSLSAAVAAAGDDLAAIILAPVHQPLDREQEYATREFAQQVRAACDANGAALILDEVRVGFRLDLRGSWDRYGIQADLSAWSKAIANGYPLSAVTGIDALRQAASEVYVTGSFWYSSVPMAAAIATITEIAATDAIAHMAEVGSLLQEGLTSQAAAHGLDVQVSGPPQMPLMLFRGDDRKAQGARFSQLCVRDGVYLHPAHNWFVSAAHTTQDIEQTLDVTDRAFAALVGTPVAVR